MTVVVLKTVDSRFRIRMSKTRVGEGRGEALPSDFRSRLNCS